MFFPLFILTGLFLRLLLADKNADVPDDMPAEAVQSGTLTGHLVNGISIVNWDEDRGPTTSGGYVHAVLKTIEKSREKTVASLKDQLDSIDDIRIIRIEAGGFDVLMKSDIDFIAWSGDDDFDGIKDVPMTFFVLGKKNALQKKCADSSDFVCFSFDPKVRECYHSSIHDECQDMYRVPEYQTPIYSKYDVTSCVINMVYGLKYGSRNIGSCKIDFLNQIIWNASPRKDQDNYEYY